MITTGRVGIRSVYTAIRALVLVAPVTLLAVWGIVYLRACLLTLASPGRPVVFRYKAPAGEVAIRADSYIVNLRQGLIYVAHPEVVDPAGVKVAGADFVMASNLDWRRGANQVVDLKIRNLSGRLTRLPTGSIQFLSLIPERNKQPTNTPFRVVVEGASVVLEDLEGKPWRQVATTSRVDVSGFGQDWVAHAAASLPGMGSVQGAVQYVPGSGVQISGSTPGLRAEAFLDHFLGTAQARKFATLRSLRVSTVTVSGPFEVFVPSSRRAVLQASAHVDATGLSYASYQVQNLRFDGVITSTGALGTVRAQAAGVTATIQGSGTWNKGEQAAGFLQASAPDVSSIPQWARRWIPGKLKFRDARYRGWVSFGKLRETEINGAASASSADYGAFHATDVTGSVKGDRSRVRVDVTHGILSQADATGSVDLDLVHRTMLGWVRADSPDLKPIAALFKIPRISGQAHVEAALSGPILSPVVQFVANGDVGFGRIGGSDVGRQSVDLAGTYSKGLAVINRGSVEGAIGSLAISGQSSPHKAGITMHVEGRGLRPGQVLAGASGSVDLSGDLTGTFAQPHYSGRIEGTGISYKGQNVTAAEVDFQGDRRSVTAKRITAVSGTMDLSGSGRYAIGSGALSGGLALQGIPATQYLGDSFAGMLDAPDIRIGGTLQKPVVVAKVQGNELVAQEVIVRSLEGLVRADRSGAVLDHATASIAGGDVSANGKYSFQTKTGEFSAIATGLDLGKLAPALGETVAISGTTTVTKAHATVKGKVVTGAAEGRLDKVQVNGVPAGDGNWTVSTDGNRVHGTLSIGQIQPELRVLDADVGYDLKAKTLDGSFDASNARIKDLLGAASRYLPASVTADPQNLMAVGGDLTLAAKLSGEVNDPDASFTTFDVKNLTYQGRPYGAFSSPGTTRIDRKWTIPGLALTGPQGTLSVQGTLEENGQIDLKAMANQFHLSALAPFVAALSSSSGIADLQASATGATRNPVVTGHGKLTHLAKAPLEAASPNAPVNDLAIDLPTLSVNGSLIHAVGTYSYAGFGGSFDASAPFSYSGGLGNGEAKGGFTINERSLTDLPILNSYLDPARTTGTVGGAITFSGPVNALVYEGGVDLQAKSLGLRLPDPASYIHKVDDTIQGLTASLHLTPQHTVALDATGKILRGGGFSVNASAPLVDLAPILSGSVDPVIRQFLDGPLAGRVALDHADVRQSAPGGYLAARINGSSILGGTVSKPALGTQASHGAFEIASLDTVIPTLPASGGQGSVPIIDPSFFLDATLSTPARVRSATADLRLTGSGDLRGVLSDPRASANLAVLSGSIRLPGGVVRLDEGGSVAFRFRHPFGETPIATLDVDLQGHSSITAIRYGGNTQRYDVLLQIRGDLLKDQGLELQAFSNPPDLSSQEALAQLGALGYIEGIGSAEGGQSEAQRRITQALAGFALPAVTDPVTASLARSLGLSYISIEYNPFELTTLSAARALSNEFSLQYRGQIGQPPAGLRPIQDFRLVYTPRRVPGALRNFSLSLGTDQDHPWKVALEYGTRFGRPKGRPSTKKTQISP